MLQGGNNCCVTTNQVIEGFLAAPPLISQTIEDLTVGHPNFLVDLLPTKPFPLGNGTQMQKIIFRGLMPEIERGFDKWAQMENPTGCDPCAGPGCGYHWNDLGGYGLERKNMTLMQKDYRTPDYCVNLIKYTYQFREVMEQIMKNLWRQVSFIKAWNINHNALTALSKKFVVDSAGPKINTANPYVYPNIGNARLSNLNIDLLEFFYNWLVLNPDVVPFGSQDGAPYFSVMASKQVLSRMWRDNPALREDIRHCDSVSCEQLGKYNFMYTVRGMFIPAPILLPRRFNIIAGEPVEVLPYLNGIPMEIGFFTGINPAYEAATHEEVLIMGRDPLSIFVGSEIETLGAGTDFGPQPNYLNWFKWVNPETCQDPFRRVGFFANHIEIGIQQDKSDGVFAVLVERPAVGLTFQVNPSPICPPTIAPCDNLIPPTDCPCPQILGTVAIPTVDNKWLFTFAVPIDVLVAAPITVTLQNGGQVTGTVAAISADGLVAEIVLDSAVDLTCNKAIFVGACYDTLACSATVYAASDCRSGATNAVKLTLSDPIKAVTPGDLITGYFCDGTTQTLEVVTADPATNFWTVRYGGGSLPTDGNNAPLSEDMICDRLGLSKVCVPPTTDATCPDCDPTVLEQCVVEVV